MGKKVKPCIQLCFFAKTEHSKHLVEWRCLFAVFSGPAVLAFSQDTRNENYKVLMKEWFFRAFRLTVKINATYFQVSASVLVTLVPVTADEG